MVLLVMVKNNWVMFIFYRLCGYFLMDYKWYEVERENYKFVVIFFVGCVKLELFFI